VLDTNVLMHDPTAIFRFDEHDISFPMIVLEELDAGKKGSVRSGRNVRQVSRFLDELMASATKTQIDKGSSCPTRIFDGGKKQRRPAAVLPDQGAGRRLARHAARHGADNAILGQTLALQREFRTRASRWCRRTSTCASRPRSSACTPRTTTATRRSKTRTCCTRRAGAAANFWERTARTSVVAGALAHVLSRAGPMVARVARNQFLYQKDSNGLEALVRSIDGNGAVMELVRDYQQRSAQHLGHHGAQPRAELRAQPAA
jgi:PhoH-like ATPase